MSKAFALQFKPHGVVLSWIAVITLSLFSKVARGENDPPRRWKIEYERDGKWMSGDLFDSRPDAQAKLDRTRQSKTASTLKPVIGRVVPTDWSRWEHLGALSAKYESGGRASGKGDPGGVSYGSYQLSSKVGTAQKFVDQYYADWFHGTKPGTDEFSALWKQLAAEREPELAAYEHLFIADTHYQPFADRLRKDVDLNLDQHSNALRDVAWSTAVQHGSGNKIFHRALKPAVQEHRLDQLSDEELIGLVYQERGRFDANGKSVY
jgi:hypothetical protein